jgi:hypothetical protein
LAIRLINVIHRLNERNSEEEWWSSNTRDSRPFNWWRDCNSTKCNPKLKTFGLLQMTVRRKAVNRASSTDEENSAKTIYLLRMTVRGRAVTEMKWQRYHRFE